MLESFTVDTFSPLIGTSFVMHVDGANSLPLELVHATSQDRPGSTAGRPFSVVFRGPRTPVAMQRIYPLEHATLGVVEIFLVPVGPDEHGMCYEAIFT
ncbi:MAG TPA: hypothetical protein VGJ60_23410 [Chloroflexota bacterium]|jgi:hypothetical protein